MNRQYSSHRTAEGTWICSGAVRVTDPTYEKDLEYVRRNVYAVMDATLGPWNSRVTLCTNDSVGILTAWAAASPEPAACDWENAGICLQVDSGKCGIFDDAAYPAGTTGARDDLESFYGKACAATALGGFGLVRSAAGAGFGVVSRAGDRAGVGGVFGLRPGLQFRRACEAPLGTRVDAVRLVFVGNGDDGTVQ